MPLKDRDVGRPRRLPRLGIIRLGYKETKTKTRSDGSKYEIEYPVQADHFVLTDAPEIVELYGQTPRELDVILPFPDVQRNFDAWYTVWAGGVLVCKGDGQFVDYASPFRIEQKRGRVHVYRDQGDTLVNNGVAQCAFTWNGESFGMGDHVPCPGEMQDFYPHCRACRRSGILKVMMADPRLFRLGYYQIATGSGRNYDTIKGVLELIHSQAGRVNGIPFKLRLVEEPTVYIEDGKRYTTDKWFVQLEPDPTYTRSLYQARAQETLGPIEEPPQLEAPEVDEETGEIVAEEQAPPPIAEEGGPAVEGEERELAPLETARAYTSAAGTRLGDLDPHRWRELLDTANAIENPNTFTQELKQHLEVLLFDAQMNGNGTDRWARPENGFFRPDQVRQKINVAIEGMHGNMRQFSATEKQRGYLAGLLNSCFTADQDRCRHSVLGWLFGKQSITELTKAEASAAIDWLTITVGEQTELHWCATAEAHAILNVALMEAGQQVMVL